MKTFPVAYVGPTDTQNAVLRWQIRQIMDKTKGLVAIIPEQKKKQRKK